MKKVNNILLLAICWSLIFISHIAAVAEVKVIAGTSLDPKGHSTSNNKTDSKVENDGSGSMIDHNIVDNVKDGKDQVNGSEKGVQIIKAKEKSGEKKQISSEKDKDDGDRKKKPDKGSDTKEISKELEVSSSPVRKEDSRVEECDASNSCKVKKIGLVACLRVPGNESPELSLLVQNKGKGPLSAKISAPEFVKLEKTQIQLKENENYKVKVTIMKAGNKNSIVLATSDGNCTLDLKDTVIALNLNKETISTVGPDSSINFLKRIPIIMFVFFGALVVAASGWMCLSYRKRHLNSSKYQKMGMDLPVTGGEKVEFDSNDGWDNSWGDDWDDEEAPKTPSMPLTPSVSAKGLAPRRLIKDVWKD